MTRSLWSRIKGSIRGKPVATSTTDIDASERGMQAVGIDCGYGERLVLESLSLAVHSGEVLALLGPNGSGKTTMLRALARLIRPRAGAVLLDGQDIWSMPARQAAQQTSLTPQSERRDWPLSVEEAVMLGRAPHRGWWLPYTRDDRQLVDDILRQTGLEALRERPITELSGGEWRRVLLARSLAQRPRTLLLDEPTAHLDLRYQIEALELVRRLATREGLAVVITLHDLNHAALCADQIAILSNRTLATLGTPEEALTPEVISQVFGIEVTVLRHPVYGTPLVVPLLHQGAGIVDIVKGCPANTSEE